METWKQIEHDGIKYNYEISTEGRVRNMKTGHIMAQSDNGRGYLYVVLKKKSFRVNRLVAIAFIPNPNNYSDVNHKDKNRHNNRVENLEWIPHDEHVQKNKGRKVKCIETNTIYDSTRQASRETGIAQPNIIKVCQGKLKTCGGFHWEYVD